MQVWLKNAIFYEIYPQTFKDTNSDGIGDINGIIEKLDYISDMGFNAIWLNPCFASPFTDAGYDVEDYYKVAPRYGTNDDLKRLFDEAHKKGIRVMLDLVPGHTSLTCKWFKESLKPQKNEYSGRYIWTDSVWKSCDGYSGIRGTMRGFSQRDGAFGVNFYATQPALNYGFAKVTESWQSPVDSEDALSTRAAMIDVICFWLGMGCDGFRVDMAMSLVKADDGYAETIKLWQDVFKKVKAKYPDSAFVSEWGMPDKALLAGFDMDFLLPTAGSHYKELFRTDKPYFSKKGEGDVSAFFDLYMENVGKTGGKGLMCIPSGNHDTPRISYTLDEKEMKVAFAFLMAMPGAPFIYYGDEIAMRYLDNIESVEGGYERTGTRSPMQWDDSVNAGFSLASPDSLYIMIDPSDERPTVKKQLSDENSVMNELKRQINIRKNNVSLQSEAPIEIINAKKDAYPLVFKRGDDILVAINPSDKEKTCDYNGNFGDVIYQFNGISKLENGKLTVPPQSASYIKIK